MNDKIITLDDYLDDSQNKEIIENIMKQVTINKVEDPVMIWIEKEDCNKLNDMAETKGLTPYQVLVDCIRIGLHIMVPIPTNPRESSRISMPSIQ